MVSECPVSALKALSVRSSAVRRRPRRAETLRLDRRRLEPVRRREATWPGHRHHGIHNCPPFHNTPTLPLPKAPFLSASELKAKRGVGLALPTTPPEPLQGRRRPHPPTRRRSLLRSDAEHFRSEMPSAHVRRPQALCIALCIAPLMCAWRVSDVKIAAPLQRRARKRASSSP